MRKHKCLILFLILLTVFSENLYSQGKNRINNFRDENKESSNSTVHSIPIHADFTEQGINRFLAIQNYPSFNGIVPGTNYHYSISMTRPTIFIRQNLLQVRFSIIINSDLGNFIIPIAPNIKISQYTFYYSEVIATFENFDILIQQSSLPAQLKQIIIDGYNSLELKTFPSRILDYALFSQPGFMNVSFQNMQFQFAALDHKLRLTFTAMLLGVPPTFHGYWLKRGPYLLSVKFYSSVSTVVRDVKIFDVAGHDLTGGVQNYELQKDTYTPQIDLDYSFAEGYYYVVVVFNSPFGEYVRKYQLGFLTATYNTWFDMSYVGGIN